MRRRLRAARWPRRSAFVLLAWPAAGAKYRGTDVLGNLSPESLLGDGSLADRYPLERVRARLPRRRRVTDLGRRAADDRALGRRAAVEPDAASSSRR